MSNINNPYLDSYKKEMAEARWPGRFDRREELVRQYSWAIPNTKVIEKIAKWGNVIEIGAGGGYWASLLKQTGANIVAFDSNPGLLTNHYVERRHFDVKRGSYEMLASYPDYKLLLCWPPSGDRFGYECVLNYQGTELCYVGETLGCTGDRNLERLLQSKWKFVDEVFIPTWPGLRDTAMFYQRK